VILRCALTRRGPAGAELIPVQLDGMRPCPASGPAAQMILSRLARLSAERNTTVEVRGQRGYLAPSSQSAR
jgi:hypothetical protein